MFTTQYRSTPVRAALSVSAALILAGCSTTAPVASADVSGGAATLQAISARYEYLADVALQPGDRPDHVSRELRGRIIEWADGGCAASVTETCRALVGVSDPAALGPQGAGRRIGRVERNRDVFSGGGELTASMGGAITMWSGGAITMWSGGAITMWSGGSFQPVPQNTGTWQRIGLERAQQMAPGLGAGVTVAVIDTGIDLMHPAFQGALSPADTWRDFFDGDTSPQEVGTLGEGGYGHGTNVAGIVLQVAPGVKIMPLRVLGPDGSGDVAMVAQAIGWAVAHGAGVINLSLGSAEASSVVQDAVRRACEAGVQVVTSAGNDNLSKITFPAALAESKGQLGERLLSVGSVDAADVKSRFSNYGANLEVMAPGEQVYAPAPGGRLTGWSGTSMSAPMVSGALALALGQPLNVAPKDLGRKLSESAVNIYSVPGNAAYRDRLGQRGRLNLPAFLQAVVK